MKVIFLDIDGVLNCRKTPNPRKFPYIVDEQLLARYHAVLRRTGARTVLASTWRYDPVGCFAAKHHGVPFIDMTPDLPSQTTAVQRGCRMAAPASRGHQICRA